MRKQQEPLGGVKKDMRKSSNLFTIKGFPLISGVRALARYMLAKLPQLYGR